MYMRRLCRNIHSCPVIQNADSIILLTDNASGRIRIEFQLLSGIDVRISNIAACTAHQETFFTMQRKRIASIHSTQSQELIIIHVANKDIFVSAYLGKFSLFPGKGNSQGLISRADTLFSTSQGQILTDDIGSISRLRIIDTLVGMQAYIAILSGRNTTHIDGRMLASCIGAPRHRDTAARCDIQRTAGFHAQGHIALDIKGQQIAICITVSRNISRRHI